MWKLVQDKRTFIIKVSERKNKKYDVYEMHDEGPKYLLSFGQLPYQQYHDKLGHYSYLDHNDPERRKRYYARHGKDAEVGTAKWFSSIFLWNG